MYVMGHGIGIATDIHRRAALDPIEYVLASGPDLVLYVDFFFLVARERYVHARKQAFLAPAQPVGLVVEIGKEVLSAKEQPVIATGLDPTNLDVMARLNGELRQNSNTSDLLFSVAKLVSYISDSMLLLPGDVIMTGTPSGVGPIAPGDVVEIEISGVGVLRNPVVAEE